MHLLSLRCDFGEFFLGFLLLVQFPEMHEIHYTIERPTYKDHLVQKWFEHRFCLCTVLVWDAVISKALTHSIDQQPCLFNKQPHKLHDLDPMTKMAARRAEPSLHFSLQHFAVVPGLGTFWSVHQTWHGIVCEFFFWDSPCSECAERCRVLTPHRQRHMSPEIKNDGQIWTMDLCSAKSYGPNFLYLNRRTVVAKSWTPHARRGNVQWSQTTRNNLRCQKKCLIPSVIIVSHHSHPTGPTWCKIWSICPSAKRLLFHLQKAILSDLLQPQTNIDLSKSWYSWTAQDLKRNHPNKQKKCLQGPKLSKKRSKTQVFSSAVLFLKDPTLGHSLSPFRKCIIPWATHFLSSPRKDICASRTKRYVWSSFTKSTWGFGALFDSLEI